MDLPKHWDLMHPILEVCKDGKRHHRRELLKIVANRLNLSDEDRTKPQAVGNQTIFENRLGWATFHLKNAGFVNQDRGDVSITDEGKKILEQKNHVDKKFLESVPKYQEYINSRKESNKQKERSTITERNDASEDSPEDRIDDAYREIRGIVEKELLRKIKENTPDFFEELVVKLVRKMGYGVDHKITGKSGDGGIDGVIKDDKLGLNEIYLQAKRLQGPVSSQEVRDFAGALSKRDSQKGIFITTSDFTRDAKEFVKEGGGPKIVLINGEKLVEYMYDYGIGVKEESKYEIKTVDEDYFSS